jgi:hypothetical protein
MVREESTEPGTPITCSRNVASSGRPLRVNAPTAQQKYTVVVGYNLIEVSGGPRARGDLGFPPAARTLSGGSLLAWQCGAETWEIGLERADAIWNVLPRLPEKCGFRCGYPELGASAV